MDARDETARGEREEAYHDLLAFHAKVDRDVARLRSVHAKRLACGKGCSSCCADGLDVHEVEAERIARGRGARLLGERAHASGACAFLGEHGECRIYPDRPLVCRTHGLPLAWFEERAEGRVEMRDICHLNEAGGPPLEDLDAGDVWHLALPAERLARIQRRFAGGERKRVPLRALFERLSCAEEPRS